MITRLVFLVLISLAAIRCNPANQQAEEAIDARLQEALSQLLPTHVPSDNSPAPATLKTRMEHYRVPGVSIVYFENGAIQWAKGFGNREVNKDAPVDTATLFQAASISKPVAASAILKMVEEGTLDLDAPVNQYLPDWQVPDNLFTQDSAVTLRRLLTHSAGLTVHGFPGYAPEDFLPSTREVLSGDGNTDEVLPDLVPGTQWRYSGGGYTVAQLLAEQKSGFPFEKLMQRLVLEPAGMVHSTYEQPLPNTFAPQAALAHMSEGERGADRWRAYPEKAAAGLWTTPSDLARWAIALQKAYSGNDKQFIGSETARKILTPHLNEWGLGPSLQGNGDSLIFSHGGSNYGFKCQLVAFAKQGGAGAVIMTNGDRGYQLAREVLNSLDKTYNWGGVYQTDTLEVRQASAEELEPLLGVYTAGPSLQVEITIDGEQLLAIQTQEEERDTFKLRALRNGGFFDFKDQNSTEFMLQDGLATKMIVDGYFELHRQAPQ